MDSSSTSTSSPSPVGSPPPSVKNPEFATIILKFLDADAEGTAIDFKEKPYAITNDLFNFYHSYGGPGGISTLQEDCNQFKIKFSNKEIEFLSNQMHLSLNVHSKPLTISELIESIPTEGFPQLSKKLEEFRKKKIATDRCEICKDISSFANSCNTPEDTGGYIVMGVTENPTGSPKCFSPNSRITQQSATLFTKDVVSQFFSGYYYHTPDFSVESGSYSWNNIQFLAIFIHIPYQQSHLTSLTNTTYSKNDKNPRKAIYGAMNFIPEYYWRDGSDTKKKVKLLKLLEKRYSKNSI